jgi:hypothetical protein
MLTNPLVEIQQSRSRSSRTCQLKLRSKILRVRVEVALAAVLRAEPNWHLWFVGRRSGSRALIIEIPNRYPSTLCKSRHIVTKVNTVAVAEFPTIGEDEFEPPKKSPIYMYAMTKCLDVLRTVKWAQQKV